MHIYFHESLLGIAFKYFIDDKDCTAQSVCKNNASINHYPQHVLFFHIIFLLKCNVFVLYLKKQDIFLKAVLILILYHVFILILIYI